MTHQSVANAEIVKIDDEKRLVFGWASIIKDEGGKILLDRQDDFIDSEDELESAAYDYVLKSRDGGEMHVRRGVAKMVESVVFTEEKQRALGIPVGSMPTGWWIGFKVNDDRVWQQVKKGEYAGFSVHGTGKRQSTELPLSKITEIGKADKKKKKNKIATVMGEFKRGKLKSSSGEKVTDPKQAMAIAISEQKRAKMKKISLSHIIGKVEELAKVGDKPGHPFRGNQYTSGKARPRIGGGSAPAGSIPHGGTKASFERAKAKQKARAERQKAGKRTGAGSREEQIARRIQGGPVKDVKVTSGAKSKKPKMNPLKRAYLADGRIKPKNPEYGDVTRTGKIITPKSVRPPQGKKGYRASLTEKEGKIYDKAVHETRVLYDTPDNIAHMTGAMAVARSRGTLGGKKTMKGKGRAVVPPNRKGKGGIKGARPRGSTLPSSLQSSRGKSVKAKVRPKIKARPRG